MEENVVIFAPHADDEIIGCFEVLESGIVTAVAVPDDKTRKEMAQCSEHYSFSILDYSDVLSNIYIYSLFLFPDPHTELHPFHKFTGLKGLEVQHKGGAVVFYTTNMNTNYLREVKDSRKKRNMLDRFYSNKASLWSSDHRYFLFEGHIAHITEWKD